MGTMNSGIYSLFWVMQDLYDQPYTPGSWVVSRMVGFNVSCCDDIFRLREQGGQGGGWVLGLGFFLAFCCLGFRF